MSEPQARTHDPWQSIARVEAELALELGMPELRVKDLLNLSEGSVLNTGWKTNQDLPLRINGKLLGWVEFDAAGENITVRLTEFAWERSA